MSGAFPLTVPKRIMTPEKVLVVPARCLWDRVTHTDRGLITEGVEQLAPVVATCGSFMERSAAETDPEYKQVIPYAVISHAGSYFLLRRKTAQSERRLHDKLSIGIGGHINPTEGVSAADLIQNGLTREVNEELHIAPGYRERLVGLINDDTTDVGRVHLGVLFEIETASSDVTVRETTKMEGDWAVLGRLGESYERLETWSQIVYDSYLRTRLLHGRTGTTG
jgi:predicted NUDIX family phosphoesterase